MSGCVRVCMKRVAVFLAAVGFVALTAAPAFSGKPVEGCDERVLSAMQSTAQARVADSKAIDDEIFTQDDSVLALTCFNQSAAVAAQQAGATFSGDFRKQLAPVVDDSMKGMLSNFSKFSVGGSTGQVDYTTGLGIKMPQAPTSGADTALTFNCDQMSKLWNTVNSQGVNPGVPYSTLKQVIDPADCTRGGSMFNASKCSAASNAQRSQANYNVSVALPKPSVPINCKNHCKRSGTYSAFQNMMFCFNPTAYPGGVTAWNAVKAASCP
jgi:hypothetical protein